jgi:predicted acyltransferase
MAFLGMSAGRMLVNQRSRSRRNADGTTSTSSGAPRTYAASLTVRWTIMGLILCTIAGFLCGWSKENGWDPVNKNRWSPSFILLLSGWGHLLLSGFFWICDAWSLWDGSPFRGMGANGLGIYLISELMSDNVIFTWSVNSQSGVANHAEGLSNGIGVVLILLSIARVWQLQKFSWGV